MERESRAVGWLMVGQLVAVTICDGREARFAPENSDTNTETEAFTTEDDDEMAFNGEGYNDSNSPMPLEVVVGRVYSYDYIVKLLILSK